MPHYMLQFAYTAEAWNALTKNPVDRSAGIDAMARKLGGRFISLHYTMGEYDGVSIIEAPDDVSAMAMILGGIAPGHLRATKTTRLFTIAEGMEAMRKAQGLGYKAPGA